LPGACCHDRDASAQLEQIAYFCHSPHVPERLAPLREPGAVDIRPSEPQAAEIIDAFLGLWEQNERRRTEHKQQHAAPGTGTGRGPHVSGEGRSGAGQDPVADHDPGWEF
jgi:hypothetical protein